MCPWVLFPEEQGGEGCGAVPCAPAARLAQRCPGSGNKSLSLGNTLTFGQPEQRHKHKFKVVFTELCLHGLRHQLCLAVVLLVTEYPRLEGTHV